MKTSIKSKHKEYIYDKTEPSSNGAYNKYIEIEVKNRNRIKKEKGFYLHMGNGDVDRKEFPIPKCLTRTIVRTLKNNYYRYSHPLGRPTTRQLISEYENFICGLNRYTLNNIGIVFGSTGGFSSAMEILMRYYKFQGSALFTQPTFPVYEAVLWKRFGIKKIIGHEKNGFLVTPKEIESQINEDIKFIILTSPNFPFGKAYSKKNLEEIVKISNRTKTYIIFDEIFYDLPFKEISNIGSVKDNQNYIIRIKGFSKDRAVPGFRIGYVLADESFINELNKFANHYYGFPPSLFEPFIEKDMMMRMLMKGKKEIKSVNLHDLPIVAKQKLQILGNSKKDLKEYKTNIQGTLKKYKNNRDTILSLIKNIPGMRVIAPDAGINLGVWIKHKGNSFTFFKKMFFETGVILAPGDVFDMPELNWYRFTFSNNLDVMKKALWRIKVFLT